MKALEDYKNIHIKDFALNAKGFVEVDGQLINFELASYGYTKNRLFFVCPICQQRQIKLYRKSGAHACRQCHGLIYRSSLISAKRRQIRSAQKARKRLSGSGDIFKPFPNKPSTMHWRKYTELKLRDKDIRKECSRLLLRGEL